MAFGPIKALLVIASEEMILLLLSQKQNPRRSPCGLLGITGLVISGPYLEARGRTFGWLREWVRSEGFIDLKDLTGSFLGSFQTPIKSKGLSGFVIGFVWVRFYS